MGLFSKKYGAEFILEDDLKGPGVRLKKRCHVPNQSEGEEKRRSSLRAARKKPTRSTLNNVTSDRPLSQCKECDER